MSNLRKAEKAKKSTWIPSGGDGIGLWKGRRVYYANGKRQSGLTIRNPITDSVANVTKGLLIGGAKTVYGATKNTSNALLGMLSPWNLAAMGRTKRNIKAIEDLSIKKPRVKSQAEVNNENAKIIMKNKPDEYFGTKIPSEKTINADGASNKKKLVITQEQIHKALRNSGE